MQPLTPNFARQYGYDIDHGLVVSGVRAIARSIKPGEVVSRLRNPDLGDTIIDFRTASDGGFDNRSESQKRGGR